MHVILTLLRKDIRLFMRNKVAFGLTFIVPIVLIYVFGSVFGVNRSSSGPAGVPIAVVSQTDAAVATAITDGLRAESSFKVITTWADENGEQIPLTEARVRELIHDNDLRFALVFPPDTISDESFGLKLKFLNNPRNEIETQTVNGLLQKVIFTSAPTALMDGLRKRATNFIGAEQADTFYTNLANTVEILHADGTIGLYMHLRRGTVAEGAQVRQGQQIGLSGNSGWSTGPHVHVQVQRNCGIWWCQSIRFGFAEDANLVVGETPRSQNCP